MFHNMLGIGSSNYSIPTKSTDNFEKNEVAPYTVGFTESGRIQLVVGFSTLTMTDQGTVNLIEDLAHAIRKRYKVEIVSNDQNEEDI
jgi:hypothetical protein